MKYHFSDDVKRSAVPAAIAAVFASLQLASYCISHFGSFLYSPHEPVCSTLIFSSFFLLYFIGVKAVYSLLDRFQAHENAEDGVNVRKRHGLLCAAVIILGWSPWLYAFYPGSLWSDMCWEYDQYYSSYSFDSAMQFPPFPTYIMGVLMDIGKIAFGSQNAGMFLYIILQTLVCVSACAGSLALLEELGVRRKIVILFLLFYAFFPDFGASVQLGANNVLNYGLMLLACTQVCRFSQRIREGTDSWRDVRLCLCFAGFALLSCLWRREMLYIWLLTAALLAVCAFRRRLLRTGALLSLGILAFCLCSAFSDWLIIEKLMDRDYSGAPDAKFLSLPLRQTAHFVRYHSDLVSDMEMRILDRCFEYGYYGIERNYNPSLADSLIFSFSMKDPWCSREFYRVYWSFLRKDPTLFLESLIAASYGYYSILPNSHAAPGYESGAGMRLPLLTMMKEPDRPLGHVSGIGYRPETEELREMLRGWLSDLEGSFNAFFGFGIWTFLLVVLCSYSVLRESRVAVAIPYIVPVMLCLACIASPVNDCGRYYMGIFYLMPLLTGTAMCRKAAETGSQSALV